MKNGEESDFGAEMFGIAGNALKSGGAGLKHQVVDDLLVLKGEAVQLRRDGEDDVEVRNRQQFGLAPLQPFRPCQILTFWAVAVAAGVVANALMLAVAALFFVPAQGRGAAAFDGSHQAVLMREQSIVRAVSWPVAAEDVGHFEGGAAHGAGLLLCFSGAAA